MIESQFRASFVARLRQKAEDQRERAECNARNAVKNGNMSVAYDSLADRVTAGAAVDVDVLLDLLTARSFLVPGESPPTPESIGGLAAASPAPAVQSFAASDYWLGTPRDCRQ